MDNKVINEISEILQDIREEKELDKLIESIEKIETLSEELDKEAYRKLKKSFYKTLKDVENLYDKHFFNWDPEMADFLHRKDGAKDLPKSWKMDVEYSLTKIL